MGIYGPAYKILVLIVYTPMHLINAQSYVFGKAGGLNGGPSLHLHPLFVYMRRKSSGKSVHTCTNCICAVCSDLHEPSLLADAKLRQYNKYGNLMHWPIW